MRVKASEDLFIHDTEQVTWIDGDDENPIERNLGVFTLPDVLYAHSKRAELNQTTQFNITDPEAWGDFTVAMITRPNFTWHMTSSNLKVRALEFPICLSVSQL